MNVNQELAAWGEAPATADEHLLADLLDSMVDSRGSATPPPPRAAPADFPALRQSLTDLTVGLQHLQAVASAAASPSPGPPTLPWSDTVPPSGAAPLPDPFPGEYRPRRWLGRGAFGQVFLADDLNLDCPVAMKTLPPAGTSAALATALAALRTDARALARVRHRNVVAVFAWRQSGPDHYLILRYVDGGSLADRLALNGPLPWQLAARCVADVGEGLRAAHACGLVHRDVKPANLLWDSATGEALLTDFGVAARLGEATGQVAGTAAYMAPEAFVGQVSPALDVYGLAATLFHLVTGELPFPQPTLEALRRAAALGLPIPDPRCDGLPRHLEEVLRQGLTPNPAQRPSLADFVGRLRGALNLSLADAFAGAANGARGLAAVDLRLVVRCQTTTGAFAPVAATHPPAEQLVRDMKRVPPPPAQVRLRTGDRVRVEVVADRPGYVAVFNVGPQGGLNLLWPADPLATPVAIQPLQPLHVIDVEMTPPTGRERLVALWSRTPLPLQPEELRGLAESGAVPVSASYQATRDMLRVQQAVQGLPPEDWRAVVLELDHVPR